jgi:hypothetical protein
MLVSDFATVERWAFAQGNGNCNPKRNPYVLACSLYAPLLPAGWRVVIATARRPFLITPTKLSSVAT